MYEWFCLPLEPDFTDCLKELGRLPVATMRNYVQEIRKVNDLTKTNKLMAIEKKELLEKTATTPEGIIWQERYDKLQAERE